MKKMLLLLVCLTTFAWLHAEEVTVTLDLTNPANNLTTSDGGRFTNPVQSGGLPAESFGADGVFVKVDFGDATDSTQKLRFYGVKSNSCDWRCSAKGGQKNQKFTVTAPGTITKIEITGTKKAFKANNGTLSGYNWTGSESAVEFQTTGQIVFTKMTVTYTPAGPATSVDTPIFSPAEGAVEAGTKVEINCSTEGAKIYYTTDETDPTSASTPYNAETGIIVNEAMTIKAIAVADGLDDSEVATAAYTIKKTTVADIAEFISLAETSPVDELTIESPVTAVYQNGQNLYVKDHSGWLLVYGEIGQNYTNGDVIAAGIKGKSQNYNGTYELSSPIASTFAAGVADIPVEPEEVTAVTAEDVNKYVIVKGSTISGVSGKNATLTVGSTTIALYNNLGINLTAGSNLNVTGFVNVFNQTVQIVPTEITTATGEEIVAAPTFDPAAGEVAKGTTVNISCATEGAKIIYQVNNGDMLEYDGTPIEINEETTIEAWAKKKDMKDSEVVTAVYTIKAEVPEGNLATFDFTVPASLNLPATSDTPISDQKILVNHVNVTFTKGGSNDAKIWDNKGFHIRVYAGGKIIVSAEGGLAIKTIQFTGATLYRIQYNGTAICESGITDVTWTNPAALQRAAATADTVEFDVVGGRTDVKTITVTTSGVYDSVDEITVDENAPVEYYNLQGVRVANPENGLYIRRQGSKVTKVLIK